MDHDFAFGSSVASDDRSTERSGQHKRRRPNAARVVEQRSLAVNEVQIGQSSSDLIIPDTVKLTAQQLAQRRRRLREKMASSNAEPQVPVDHVPPDSSGRRTERANRRHRAVHVNIS
jgi:adenosyl cobinamide kinase/adenosyl cobinamide phosphate guanylyltransferase